MNKKQNKNKRAFTLTELLIVVIVIGVLSAVTLPKFTRVIENRKVTEAEEMMSAVRTEQERRCAMDKPYTLNFDNLSDVVSSSNTKNYTYSLQAEGVSATSNKGDYTLKMLSYQDGSFCCEGDDCTKLNKNYPSCDGLTFPSSGCEGTDGDGNGVGTDPTPSDSCSDGQVRGSQACNTCGVQTTQACVGGRWVSQLGECSKTVAECETPECTNGAVSGSQSCNGCGTQTTQKCVNGKWESFLGACSKTVEECTENEDCCSYSMGSGKAQDCLKKKYGANSWEAKCSNYGNKQSCLRALYAGGSEVTYLCLMGTGNEDLKNDRNGYSGCKACKANAQVNTFFNYGFLNYACTSVPKCDIKFTNPSGGDGRFSCCRVYQVEEEEKFFYSKQVSREYSECLSACGKGAKCPDNVKPGVYLNGVKGGLNCWISCNCPYPDSSSGSTSFVGKRVSLKCKNEGKYCTNDEVVWW